VGERFDRRRVCLVGLIAGGHSGVPRYAARLTQELDRVAGDYPQLSLSLLTTAAGAEAVLLDNMTVEAVKQCVERAHAHTRRVPLECSGGINLENVRAYAETGVDYISVGALTHSPSAVDMSLRVLPA